MTDTRPSSTIYLVRHGQKQSHAGDPDLTELGIQQARETGMYLKQFPISSIISSPFRRTVTTATEIGKILNIQHTLHDALRERMNWNDNHISRQSFFQEWIKSTHDRQYVPKYGASSSATGRSMQALIQNELRPDSHLVLVSHGGAIVDLLRNLFGDEACQSLRFQYEEGEDYTMSNCAISKVVFSEHPSLELLNSVEHLSIITE
jgi:broad specificity phosphatase PhoE